MKLINDTQERLLELLEELATSRSYCMSICFGGWGEEVLVWRLGGVGWGGGCKGPSWLTKHGRGCWNWRNSSQAGLFSVCVCVSVRELTQDFSVVSSVYGVVLQGRRQRQQSSCRCVSRQCRSTHWMTTAHLSSYSNASAASSTRYDFTSYRQRSGGVGGGGGAS